MPGSRTAGPAWLAAVARLTGSRLLAATAARMTLVALPVLAVQVCGLSLSQTAVLYTAQTVPGLFAMAVGKPLDVSERLRGWCVWADLTRFALLAVLAVVVLAGARPGWLLLLVASACLGCAEVVYAVAAQAYLPRIVAPERLVTANTWLARAQGVADVAGLPAAGAVVATAGPEVAIAVAATGFVLAGILHGWLPAGGPASSPPRAGGADRWTEGLVFLVRDRTLRAVIGTLLLLNLGGGVIGALWLTHVTGVLRVPADQLGLIMAVGGVSALAGSAVVGRLLAAWGPVRCVRRALPISLAALACVPLAAFVPTIPALIAYQLVFTACAVTIAVAATTLRQLASPARLQARVFAAVRTGLSVTLPVSGLLAASVTWLADSQTAITVGVALAACALPLVPAIARSALPEQPGMLGHSGR